MDTGKLSIKKNKDTKIFCDITKCLGCKSCEIACILEHSPEKNIATVIKQRPLPKKRVRSQNIGPRTISLHCQHCADAPCVGACMSGALFKDEQTGATLHDQDKCVGCWMCVMVCPFGAISSDPANRVAVKCDLCPQRDDFACVEACPSKALFVGTKKEFEQKALKAISRQPAISPKL